MQIKIKRKKEVTLSTECQLENISASTDGDLPTVIGVTEKELFS
jgi:hypothetical protein